VAWNAVFNEAQRIVELTYSGMITAEDLQSATSHCIALGKQHKSSLFLVDSQDAQLSASFVELYNLPNRQYELEEADRSGRMAIIQPSSPRMREAARFYESVCRNRGWTVLILPTRDEAVDWLVASVHPDCCFRGFGQPGP